MRKRGIIIIKREKSATEEVDTTTDYYVHPAFTNESSIGYANGGWDKELTGIWVAKFEASGTNKDGNAVGNAEGAIAKEQYSPDETTIAKSLPNKISWRHITIGESERRSIDIATTDKEKFGINYASSHLIKNSEWGAVAYLCYSEYGNIPQKNGTGSRGNVYYNLYTGQGPKSENDDGAYGYDIEHNYNTLNGQLASTTGNITGIYDMNGGAWERVAAYLDNENEYLNVYGKSKDDNIQYFEKGKINKVYSSLWDSYEVSEEEKSNKIKIEGENELLETQDGLCNWNKQEERYNKARLRLTTMNYNNMLKHKGIGINEVNLTGISYFAPGKSIDGNTNTWHWYQTLEQSNKGESDYYGKSWDGDMVTIGYSNLSFIARGGGFDERELSGVFYTYAAYGYASISYGFRSVIIL